MEAEELKQQFKERFEKKKSIIDVNSLNAPVKTDLKESVGPKEDSLVVKALKHRLQSVDDPNSELRESVIGNFNFNLLSKLSKL
jgi:hypothetical protein